MNLTKKRADILLDIAGHAEVNLFGGSDLVGVEDTDQNFDKRIKDLQAVIQWLREQADKRLISESRRN